MENKPCDTCGSETYIKEGDSKTKFNQDGSPKHFKGYYCDNCRKYVEWINDKPKTPNRGQNHSNIAPKDEGYNNIMTANRKLYALILAVAHLSNITTEQINEELKRMEFLGN